MRRKLLLASGALVIAIGWVVIHRAMQRPIHPLSSSPTSGDFYENRVAPEPSAAPIPTPSSTITPARTSPAWQDAKNRVAILNEILISKNDNDPRLDTEFRKLTPATKTLLQDRYKAILPEKRNELGTIVFLIGREVETAEDWSFLGEIVTSAPCLSLSDCTKEDPVDTGSDEKHLDSANALTLAYPEVVSVASAQKFLETHSKLSPAQATLVREFLEKAQASPVDRVSRKARELATQYSQSLTP